MIDLLSGSSDSNPGHTTLIVFDILQQVPIEQVPLSFATCKVREGSHFNRKRDEAFADGLATTITALGNLNADSLLISPGRDRTGWMGRAFGSKGLRYLGHLGRPLGFILGSLIRMSEVVVDHRGG